MTEKTIRGILIDVTSEVVGARVADITPDLDTYYEILNCSTITITSRRIGERSRKYYDIICDDEGLLVAPTIVSAIDRDGKPMLVGNLFICSHDDEGNETSLSREDIRHIREHFRYINGYPTLCDVCY